MTPERRDEIKRLAERATNQPRVTHYDDVLGLWQIDGDFDPLTEDDLALAAEMDKATVLDLLSSPAMPTREAVARISQNGTADHRWQLRAPTAHDYVVADIILSLFTPVAGEKNHG